jgi:hypothetical protein
MEDLGQTLLAIFRKGVLAFLFLILKRGCYGDCYRSREFY